MDCKSQHMDVLIFIRGGKFDTGDDGNRPGPRGGDCFLQPVSRVMIRQCKGGKPFFHGILYQLCGTERPVGFIGMYMQINHSETSL